MLSIDLSVFTPLLLYKIRIYIDLVLITNNTICGHYDVCVVGAISLFLNLRSTNGVKRSDLQIVIDTFWLFFLFSRDLEYLLTVHFNFSSRIEKFKLALNPNKRGIC